MNFVLSAAPGFFVIEAIDLAGGEQEPVIAAAVIAWLISIGEDDSEDLDVDVYPITCEGAADFDAIMEPDGRIVVPGDTAFESLQALEEYLNSEEAKAFRKAARD